MKLRTFLIGLLLPAIVAVVAVYTRRAGAGLGESFAAIESLQRHSVARYASTVVAAHGYLARSTQRRLESDTSLAKRVLLASAASDDSLARRLEEIRRETQADVARVVAAREGARDPLVPASLVAKARDGESGLSVAFLGTDPWLVGASPLRLYEDVVGVLVLGFRLNGNIAKEIASATRTRAEFAMPPLAPERTLLVAVTPGVLVPLAVQGEFLRDVSRSTRETVLFWGVACLLCVILLIYALLELGFVRRFRRLVALVHENAEALDRGEVRELPRAPGRALWELRQLWQAMHAYTARLAAFRERVEEKSRVEAVGRMAAQVAHDLRAPLAALQVGLGDEALTALPESSASLVRAATERMRGIIDGLRERERSEPVETVPLAALVREMIGEKHAQYGPLGKVALELEIADESAEVRAQPTELRRVLSNLVDNSVQSLDGAGKVRVRVRPLQGNVRLEVEDSGKGVPPEIRDRLFERGATYGKEEGTGLGLWHARESARAWGADISLDSTPGSGTRVTLSFPPLAALVALLVLAAPRTAPAESLADAVRHHQIVPRGAAATPLSAEVPALVLELFPDEKKLGLDRAYLESLVRFKFESAGVPLRIAAPTYRADFLAGKVPADEALRPKLAVTLQLAGGASGADSVLEIELAYLRYRAERGRYVLERAWQRKHRLTGLTGLALEETVSRLLQREVARLLKERHFPAGGTAASAPADRTAPYRLEYRDEESLSSLGSVGVTAGAPLPVVARLAIWGSVRRPLVAGVSGTYLGASTRGLLFDVGYAWDRVGRTKQVAGLVLARLGEEWRRETIVPMERGLTATRVETIQALRTFVGPTYTVQWGDFAVTAGALFPVESGPDWRARALFQVGYAPLFLF